ncbi:MAG TPA: aminotransferase class I/II-fold pyridoxal phosphate-dependent enzyme [Gammaproteobacteria bacterium]|nr:aminotransferase class I/II-fold pyridoxal phosphate-dependent enzyme [Gammaproteobacteria bacterium]
MSSRYRPYGCREDAAPPLGPLAPDLTRSTTFAYPSAEQLRAAAEGEAPGEIYPRYGHPNARRFEAAVAGLEGADGAVSFASGMAAVTAIFGGLLSKGDVIVVSKHVYGGVDAVIAEDLPRFGVEVRRFDPFEAGSLERAVAGGATHVHVETPTNPLCRVVDLERVAAVARGCGALVSVDATFLPPPFQRPLAHGADLVMHSATKILGGHSDAHAGVVSGRHELLERLEGFRRRTGAVLAPDTAWLLTRSLATRELRTQRACENAARLAAYLDGLRQKKRGVAAVHYPGLPQHPDRATAERYMRAFGFMLAFEVAGGLEAAVRVYDRFRVVARAVSLGSAETLASLPLHTSHAMMSAEERADRGIADGLIRVSVGIEPYERLEADLAQALGSD